MDCEDGKRRLAISIYRSKTDQRQRGRFRTLVETDEEVRPVRSMTLYLESFDWGCECEARPFAGDVEKRSRSVINRGDSSNNLDSDRLIAHSLRSGGETSLCERGISLGHIRKFVRWASDKFRGYRYRDNQGFRYIGRAMVEATGFFDQLQMAQKASYRATISAETDEAWRRKRPTGAIAKSKYIRSADIRQ